MRKTKFFFICCFLLLASASGVFAQQDDKLLQVLKDELNKEMQELQKTENPPYHMNFRVMDEKVVNISANFGVLQGVREQHTQTLVPQVRVGSMELDNFKYNPMGSPTTTRTSSSMAYLPIEGDNWEDAIRQAIWAETEKSIWPADTSKSLWQPSRPHIPARRPFGTNAGFPTNIAIWQHTVRQGKIGQAPPADTKIWGI